jgi:hypothetical protein
MSGADARLVETKVKELATTMAARPHGRCLGKRLQMRLFKIKHQNQGSRKILPMTRIDYACVLSRRGFHKWDRNRLVYHETIKSGRA